jgi:hypothetical protein
MNLDGGACNLGWRSSRILLLLALAACSAPTDVIAVAQPEADPAVPSNSPVGVLNQQDDGTLGRAGTPAAASGAAADETEIIVAGLPAPDWQGPTFAWPLNTPLHTFFADSAADSTSGAPATGSDKSAAAHGGAYMGNPSLGGSGHSNSLSRSQPSAEQETYEHLSDADLGPWHDMHRVVSSGDAADRLIGMFAGVHSMPRQDPTLVARDSYGDRYLVILESDGCDMSADHHAGNCSGTTRP